MMLIAGWWVVQIPRLPPLPEATTARSQLVLLIKLVGAASRHLSVMQPGVSLQDCGVFWRVNSTDGQRTPGLEDEATAVRGSSRLGPEHGSRHGPLDGYNGKLRCAML